MKKPDKAVKCFNDGYNCAQAVLSAFSDELGLSEADAKRVAAPFGGGMGEVLRNHPILAFEGFNLREIQGKTTMACLITRRG
ncbi:MAG: C-GCAxxG-C-C family protein [Elusimicrobiota bacterium]